VSYLLELLGQGLQSDLGDLLDRYFWSPQTRSIEELEAICAEHCDWPDRQFQLGLAYLRVVRVEQAIGCLRQACRQKPDYLAARLALAAAYEENGQIQQAADHLELANQTHPGEAPVLFALGFCCEKLQRLEDACEYYRDAIAQDTSLRRARERLAAAAVVLGNLDEAIEQYEALRNLQPDQVWLRTALAHLYYRRALYPQAIEEFETAIAMAPENWALVDDEVEALVADGHIREAIEKLHILVTEQGSFADLQVRLGDLYGQIGEDPAALKHYHAALEIEPGYLEARVKLGTQHLACGRWEEAAEAFHEAAELNDRALTNYVGLGVAQAADGNTARAVNSFDLAAAIEPNSTLLLTEMARLQLKAAVADQFLKNFEVNPGTSMPEVHLDNDDLLQQQIQRHAEQVQRHPAHADVRYRYGVLLRAEGRLGEALEQFLKAVEINPTYVRAIVKLGITQQELGLTDEAMETFRRALELHPHYLDLHYRLGLLYTDRHRFEEAVQHMERAASGACHNQQLRATLALALQNMGLMDRAAATWRSLWEVHHPAGGPAPNDATS